MLKQITLLNSPNSITIISATSTNKSNFMTTALGDINSNSITKVNTDAHQQLTHLKPPIVKLGSIVS